MGPTQPQDADRSVKRYVVPDMVLAIYVPRLVSCPSVGIDFSAGKIYCRRADTAHPIAVLSLFFSLSLSTR